MANQIAHGWTGIDDPTGIAVVPRHVPPGVTLAVQTEGVETAILAVSGAGRLGAGGMEVLVDRASWIDVCPSAVHAASGAEVGVEAAQAGLDIVIVQTLNYARFEPRVFRPEDVLTEDRGAGRLDDTARRTVRTIFDRSNSPPEARLVLGEVVTPPGRWSSYPPHHHAQPEVYYYRFSPKHGYGHAEEGDRVFKVQDGDLLRIMPGHDHAQCAAPGYHMYYLWAIRHLDGAPYTGFEFAPEHADLWG